MTNLVNCNISFHTNDDDKDWDTELTVVVYDSEKRAAARISNNFGRFPDHEDNGPFSLKIYNQSSLEKLQSGYVDLRIDPNGHDTWKFNFFLDLIFDDGTRLSGGQDGLVLTQDKRSQSFGLNGILKRQDTALNSVFTTSAVTRSIHYGPNYSFLKPTSTSKPKEKDDDGKSLNTSSENIETPLIRSRL